MNSTEFLLSYLLGGLAAGIAGYIIGAMRSETKSEKCAAGGLTASNALLAASANE
jgi:uncharacterized protein (UPF0333 family)